MNTPLRIEAQVVGNSDEGGANRRLRLGVPGWEGFGPGQFLMLSPGARGTVERDDPLLPRPMAVYREVSNGAVPQIEVLYKVAGRGTGLLSDARPGDAIRLVGPLGRGFEMPEPSERAVLVGGGTGIASLYELAARARNATRVEVLLGARSDRELMGAEDFAALNVDVRIATEDGSRGTKGLVTALLDDVLGEGGPGRVYVCGPTPMMRAVSERARTAGWTAIVSLENPMACGFGVCLGCAVPLADGGFALVCRDGPVFDADEVRWEDLG